MLISVKVEKLVVSAIPDLVETWTKGFGFVPVGDIEKRGLKKLNLMVFPGTVLLEKSLYGGKKKNEGIFIWCIWSVYYYYKRLVLIHQQCNNYLAVNQSRIILFMNLMVNMIEVKYFEWFVVN